MTATRVEQDSLGPAANARSLRFMENLPAMFDLIKRWQFRTTTNRPLRFRNRVVLGLEDLETRALLSSGVMQATVFDGPLSAVALVAEPVNINATSPQSQQTLSDVVPGGSTSKVLPARPVRAPIQTGPPSTGATGPTGQPALGTLAPVVNTTLDVTLPGVNAPISQPSPTGTLPGQGTAGGARVGGQNLLPGGATTPPGPAQQILAGIVNTADPYAAFEKTILTKEGEKSAGGDSANGQEVPMPSPNTNPQKPGRASGAAEEQGETDLPDPGQAGTDDQAALDRDRTDAFFTDSALMG